ncbi:hypothetical protein CEUSTIGMA_g2964.t1 [Chlamydomonas eustigma]|uniref:Uncharacterized protein n=1 Tax=Chlamydomonas eustigma TaxID=1157962 RepID=A0A250WXH8_9CHLO|nr:hypothetical protein CEUSTIGMA_g2964.t1 [Chlamydomonas eustigma]|eukprot:GAX75521.1 hypothetical protein CEUSTIGMA_g2964.t1 [Chlamydomonas eustigma]
MSENPSVALTDAPELLKFLQSTLEQLEEASGGVDEEARAALAKLKGVALTPPAPDINEVSNIASMTDEQLSAHFSKLEGQMTSIQSMLAQSSSQTRSLVADSAALWSGQDNIVSKKDQAS